MSDRSSEDERLDDIAAKILNQEPIPGPVLWRDLTGQEARATWAELAGFVRWLLHRYRLSGSEVPPCWFLHGAHVEELTALWGHHEGSYDAMAPAQAMADWHRVLAETRHRLRDWSETTKCTVSEHRDGLLQPWVDDSDWATRFRAFVTEDVAARQSD